jgi:MFS family permease
MLKVLATSWALLLGMLFLMVGNGMQGSLLGIRGTGAGFTTYEISYVMSAYFLGFLLGSQLAPGMIRKVGHVRVFAALGSIISAVLVLYPVMQDWIAWSLMRALIGFSFAGVYITAESWLNNSATNETRGQAMSAYMIVQMIGIISSQALLNLPDPTGFFLFILPSVLVSLSFLPLLLAATTVPVFDTIKPLSFGQLFRISPLGCMGMLLTGSIFSAMFGMAAVWGAQKGYSVQQITIFVGALYVGGLVFQYPIGWASDRMDRRKLILAVSAFGAVAMLLSFAAEMPFPLYVVSAVLLGGMINPLYSLLIAYSNDFLTKEQMPAASAGLIFLNGLGAIGGPVVAGWLMGQIGPEAFFLFLAILFAALALYAAWRMTRRAAPSAGAGYAAVVPSASPVAVDAVLDRASERAAERSPG